VPLVSCSPLGSRLCSAGPHVQRKEVVQWSVTRRRLALSHEARLCEKAPVDAQNSCCLMERQRVPQGVRGTLSAGDLPTLRSPELWTGRPGGTSVPVIHFTADNSGLKWIADTPSMTWAHTLAGFFASRKQSGRRARPPAAANRRGTASWPKKRPGRTQDEECAALTDPRAGTAATTARDTWHVDVWPRRNCKKLLSSRIRKRLVQR
jgi:hypothetical protein